MSWLRRLSRDRSSKQEQDLLDTSAEQHQLHQQQQQSLAYRPNTSSGVVPAPLNVSSAANRAGISASKNSEFPNDSDAMLRNSAPVNYDHPAPPFAGAAHNNGSGDLHSSPRGPRNSGIGNERRSAPGATSFEPTPDSLQRAFNEALKPYTDQINALKSDLESAHQTIASLSSENTHLNQQTTALHSWIDKRGLRPDLPVALAASMPASSVAASTLSTQLDRKMTMLNYSLHHLADSTPEALPASTVTSTLSTLLPPIQHLATLSHGGSAFAFETLIKLAGNLNSHSTGEETSADRAQIDAFYDQIDESMAAVIGRRFQARADGLEDWDVVKDVKRLEKTGAFLRKEMGISNYFVHSIQLLREGGAGGPGGPPGGGMYDDHVGK